MRILIVHNQLWAHYKAIIFNELQKKIAHHNAAELLVVQIAMVEKSRVDLGNIDLSEHQYPYELLHQGTLEEVSLGQRIKGIMKAIIAFKPEVVNITGYYDIASWVVLLYCKLRGISTVLSNESTAEDHARSGVKEFIKKVIVRSFDGYFNFGTLSKNYLISLGGKPERMLVNRNCVDNKTLKSKYDTAILHRKEQQKALHLKPHNFIFVGRLIDFKNLFQLLDAFQACEAANKDDWGLIILGDGALKSELEKYIIHHKIDKVHFLKGVSWEQVPAYLALSDVLILPSYSEPWGLVVNEAMACGMPVAVSNKCGCAVDLVKEAVNGYTFNPENRREISLVLDKFINNSSMIPSMGKASEVIISEYSPEQVAKEMFEGYLKLCRPKK
jgi:glycosyltransferase involved in cell wall biosynthesis